MRQDIHTRINWLNREQIERIMTDWGFHCSADETENELREALRENVMDGTIPEEGIDE